MNTEFQFDDRSRQQNQKDQLDENANQTNEATGAIDMMKRDRFELLSAYLDGEVTAAERRQVEEWLAKDPDVKRLHGRLLKLRQGMRTMPVPQTQPVEETVQQVFARLRRRGRKVLLFGGVTVAACVLSTVGHWLNNNQSLTPQVAHHSIDRQANQPRSNQTQQSETGRTEVALTINSPPIVIPKASLASPEKPSLVEEKSEDSKGDLN